MSDGQQMGTTKVHAPVETRRHRPHRTAGYPPVPLYPRAADPFVGFLENSPAFTAAGSSCGEALAAALPGAHVFKALNTVQADFMKDPTGATAIGSEGGV